MVEAVAWGIGITGTSFAVASIIKSIWGGGQQCAQHPGIRDRLQSGDQKMSDLEHKINTVQEGVARIEGKLEVLIKNLK